MMAGLTKIRFKEPSSNQGEFKIYFADTPISNIVCLIDFMNSFVDVNQCVISTVIHFNIFECPEFMNFVDPNLAHRNILNQVLEEQAKRIQNIIK